MQDILKHTSDTKALLFEEGAVYSTAQLFTELFPGNKALIIADTNTEKVAGAKVRKALSEKGVHSGSMIFEAPGEPSAKWQYIEILQQRMKESGAVPIAVGSGVINDLAKLSSHRTGVKYICVATAASMDGYTAYGSSITHMGSKQTFDCPAPYGIVADPEVIATAPAEMSASGYADLIAKIPAGADWLLADAIGAEHIDDLSYGMVQSGLRRALDDPKALREGNREKLASLTEGLLLSGFAMQACQTSRPASGAEHQFSHLWDMEDHTHKGEHVAHGFQVGIGTLASTALHQLLINSEIDKLDIEKCVSSWPDKAGIVYTVKDVFNNSNSFIERCLSETLAKHADRDEVRSRLFKLKEKWPELLPRLKAQVMPFNEVKSCLKEAGAPYEPEHVGISRHRLYESFLKVPYMRNRIGILDIALMCGYYDKWLAVLFGRGGIWEIKD